MREFLKSPALDRLMTYTKRMKYQQEVKNKSVKKSNIIYFDRALNAILTTLSRKFNFDEEIIAAVSETLELFSDTETDSDFVLPLDTKNPECWIHLVETIADEPYALC